jgi:uncharacterized protein (TIGR02996 family)
VAVHFVYRCDAIGQPTSLYRRRFEDATVLDWFRRHWQPIADFEQASQRTVEVFGADVFSFTDFFTSSADVPTPETVEEVGEALYWAEVRCEEHCVQALIPDDETDTVCYFFDDVFVQKHPDLTAYLLLDGPLPDGESAPGWRPREAGVNKKAPLFRKKGEGRLYVVAEFREDSSTYEDLGLRDVNRVDGLRVPGLCRQLMSLKTYKSANAWGSYCLRELRTLLLTDPLTDDPHEGAFVRSLQAELDDEATWRAYADWLMERGGPSPNVRLLRLALPRVEALESGDPGRCVVHAGGHVAQACIHGGAGRFNQLILFDDLWAGAHPILVDALIRYGSRWDVLSTGDESQE